MLASKLHWRLLIGTILVLMVAAFLSARFVAVLGLTENRVLARVPDLPRSFSDFDAFRGQADAYVADNFPIRPHLIAALNRVRMMAGVSGSSRVLVGRDGWLFFDNGSHLGAARNEAPPPPAEIRAWLAGLAGRTEVLKARGVAYLVVVAP